MAGRAARVWRRPCRPQWQGARSHRCTDINPTNLSTRFSWFSQVNDVATFDEQFALYFSDPSRFTAEKKQRQLACNGSGIANTTLQWERTIMCGKFTQMSYSEACNVQAPTMICQDTCRSWSAAQTRLVENPALCAPEDQLTAAQNRTRSDTLTRDFVACTGECAAMQHARCCTHASSQTGPRS